MLYKYNDTTVVELTKYRKLFISEQEMNILHFYTTNDEGFKQLVEINPDILKKVVYNNIYTALAQPDESIGNKAPLMFRKVLPQSVYNSCYESYYSVLNDIRTFPVEKDNAGNETVYFDDSFGSERTYGGDRSHEGCDIMAGNNKTDYFTVVSMTDGVVEKMGWLELGGYRIGIRSPSGGYYYYAHLSSYAEGLKEGDTVKAGDKLGMMGDTGYGEEGTTGKFDVHLHLGIYYGENEISFNPYYVLKLLNGMIDK
ncbi:MAG: M23 family metallopeptidase [Lachnospiraceae bacterium]|nr:M23 family metallopeptidase [Lachnospiraceae bacterium]